MQTAALHNRLNQLATEVGRLRRRLPEDTLVEWTGEQVAGHVEALFGFVEPTAAEIVGVCAPGDEDAIREALRLVDARTRKLRHTLGLEAA